MDIQEILDAASTKLAAAKTEVARITNEIASLEAARTEAKAEISKLEKMLGIKRARKPRAKALDIVELEAVDAVPSNQ